jgi:hypothetical protein
MPKTSNGKVRNWSGVDVSIMTKPAINGELATSNVTIKRGVYTSPLMRFEVIDCSFLWYA